MLPQVQPVKEHLEQVTLPHLLHFLALSLLFVLPQLGHIGIDFIV